MVNYIRVGRASRRPSNRGILSLDFCVRDCVRIKIKEPNCIKILYNLDMPIRYQSYTKEEDKTKILSDIMATGCNKGTLAFHSNDANYFLLSYPLIDNKAKERIGQIATLLKVEDGHLSVYDCDLTIDNEPQDIRLLWRLPASGEANEHYRATLTSDEDVPFVIETVNRYAVWEDDLEEKVRKVSLSAFPFKLEIYDNISAFNQQAGIFPVETKTGQEVAGFSETFSMPQHEEDGTPSTYFLGKVKDIKDVSIKLSKYTLKFSIIYMESFLGVIPVVASKEVFDLNNLENGKLLAISADIKANFGVDPTPAAVVKSKPENNNVASKKNSKAGVLRKIFKK